VRLDRRLLAGLPAVLALGCEPAFLGTEVGTFRIEGRLVDHGCGQSAVPTPEEASFEATLRADRSAAWWVLPGADPAPGRADGDGHYTFRRAQSVEALPASPTREACVVVQENVLSILLEGDAPGDGDPADGGVDGSPADGGVPAPVGPTPPLDAGTGAALPTRLEGTERYRYRPRSSPACRPLLASQGGVFLALPCEIDIELEGTAN